MLGPMLETVIEPPGPGALLLSKESNCAFAPTVIPGPVVKLLCNKIVPPLALCRWPGASSDDTWIVSFTVTIPPLEWSVTDPPAPLKTPAAEFNPVVAVMSAPLLAVISPVVLTMNTPPSPPSGGEPEPNAFASAPLKLAEAIPLAGSNVIVLALTVSRPPDESPSIPRN